MSLAYLVTDQSVLLLSLSYIPLGRKQTERMAELWLGCKADAK